MTACGSDADPNSPTGVGEAFAMRAVAVCQAAVDRKKAQGPFPYPDFNPTDPDESKLPEVERFLEMTVDTFSTWEREMRALGQPPSGQEAWSELLDAIATHVRLDVEQQAAAERGDTETFTRDYDEGVDTVAKLESATEAAGVPECAAVDH